MQTMMVIVLLTGVLLMATTLQVSANMKIELTSERVWKTDSKAFVNQSSSSSLVSSKLRYYATSIPSGFYIKSIDDRTEPVDCVISNETIKSLNLQGNTISLGGISIFINFLHLNQLVDFGSKLLLVADLTKDLVIIDPESCFVETVIYRNDTCSRIIMNPDDSFDCLVITSMNRQFGVTLDITRYDEKGQAIRSFNSTFDHGLVDEFHRLQEPYGDVVYYSWMDYRNDKIKFLEFNSTYNIVRETYLPFVGTRLRSVANFDHDRITICFPIPDIESKDYSALVHCKWVEIKNLSKIVKFSFKIPHHGIEKYDVWYFGVWDRIYVKNLKRGAFIIYRPYKSAKLFYRHVNEAGVINDENQLFYEIDEHLEGGNLHVKIYEINDDICTQLHSGGNYIYTRCVKLLH